MAVIAAEAPDVLSHAAVRACNAGALMAACLSPQRFAELRALAGSYVRLTPSQVLSPCALPNNGRLHAFAHCSSAPAWHANIHTRR